MYLLWILLVAVHWLGCIAVVLGGLLMPVWFMERFGWSSAVVWFPLGTLLVQMTSDPMTNCVLTNWENKLRRRLGKPQIQSFVGHYFLRRR